VKYLWNCLKQQRFEKGGYAIVTVRPENIEPIRCWRNAQLDVLRQNAPITPPQPETYFARNIWPTMADTEPSNILMALLLDDVHIGYGGLVHLPWRYASLPMQRPALSQRAAVREPFR